MEYAPIVIPTLNRADHLKRCIESLKANPWSIYTDIYISVDYPPSKKYEDGYQTVLDYLGIGINGFNKVNIFYQQKNLGVLKNLLFLSNEVFKKFDRIIFLEDDNELSPCFLEFCSRGLDIFENYDDIIGLNASSYVWCGKGFKDSDVIPKLKEANIVKRQLLFHACATWKKTWLMLFDFCENMEVYKMGCSLKRMKKLHNKSKAFFYYYLDYVLTSKNNLPWYEGNKIYPIDAVWDIYMMIFDRYIICPKLSLMRDWGVDGTGANYREVFSNANDITNKKIDLNTDFEFIITESIEIDTKEIFLHDKYQYTSVRVKSIKLIKYIHYLIREKNAFRKKRNQ